MHFRKTVGEIIGAHYRYALFYNFPGGLRFRLSEEGSELELMLVALRKATVVCEDVFAGQDRILLHLQTYMRPSVFGLRDMIRELRQAGIDIPKSSDIWLEKEEEGSEDGDWINCAFDVPIKKLQNILWCSLATDLGLSPNPHCRMHLLNTNTKIVVHPYDDRGMDVIGQCRPVLARLYERHNALLLDYDRDAMHATFASS